MAAVSHLGLKHPELREVLAGLRLLGTEGGAEAESVPMGHDGRFLVELPRLRQVRAAQIKVLQFEERSSALADGPSEDGGVEAHEAAVIVELPESEDDLIAESDQMPLTLAAEPQMAVPHEEVDTMLLGRDGVVVRRHLHEANGANRKLDPTRRVVLLVHGVHHPGHLERGLLCGLVSRVPRGLVEVWPEAHRLTETGAIAKDQEPEFLVSALVVEPPA